MGLKVLVVALAASACIEAQLVPCGDQLCAVNQLCVAGEVCATPDQVAACDGLGDGDVCATSGSSGRCDRGVCSSVACGNSVVDPAEACDDGNVTGGDGCAADCSKLEMCGDEVVDEGERCDDANANASDGCDACTTTTWRATAVIGGGTQATQAGLNGPNGVASDLHGNIYISDFSHRIHRVDPTGVVSTIAGTGTRGFTGDGGPATGAELDEPAGVAIDGLGNVYIADAQNDRVRRIDREGVITTIAGGGTASGEGVAATSAEVLHPVAVAVDGAGRVYIAEHWNDRVRVVGLDGTITTVASQLSSVRDLELGPDGKLYIVDHAYVYRLETSGALTTVTTVNIYGSLAIDAMGRLYVGDDFDGSIRRVDTTGDVVIAGGNGDGSSGDGGPATAAQLNRPISLAVDPAGNLFVADQNNHRVRRIDTSGVIDTFAGTGAQGSVGDGGAASSTGLLYPEALCVDAMDNIYIADSYHHRIRRIDPNGTITTIAGSGNGAAVDGGFSGDGGPATAAELSYPAAVAVDGAGNVYIADINNARVRRVDTNGIITTVAGTGNFAYSGDGGPAVDAELEWPESLAVDSTGRLYIGDADLVRRIDTNGTISTIAGGGALIGDGGPATSAAISTRGIAIDAAGNLYIAGQSRIRRVDTAGMITTVAGTGVSGSTGDGGLATNAQLWAPEGVAVDAAGRLYITEATEIVRRVDTAGIISTLAGVGASGFRGDGGLATAAYLDGPNSVAVDSAGNVIILEFAEGTVRRVTPQGTITTIVGTIDPDGMGPAAAGHLADARAIAVAPQLTLFAGGVTGTLQALNTTAMRLGVVAGRYPHDTATGALARFRTASFGSVGGVAYSSSGTIYISESSSNRLHAITVTGTDSTTWTIAAMNSSGTEGFANGALGAARFRRPSGLYFDEAAKELLVADTGNHVIRAIDLSGGIGSATVRTVAGTPATRGYFGDGAAATGALLNEPSTITRCPNNDLFIADTGSHRVRRVAAGTNTITTVLGDGVAASSGEGTPATSFPVDTPLGVACDGAGNLFVSSSTTVRLVPANEQGVVDGAGQVLTIYGEPPRTSFPASVTNCLTGLAVVDPETVRVADACAGVLVELKREKL